jgi:dihydroflavonol-4-reductase
LNNTHKYLIIGGNGFVGQHLVKYLWQLGVDVTYTFRNNSNLSFITEADKSTNTNSIKNIHLDILDVDELQTVIPKYTHIFHCANMVSFDASDADMVMHNNVEGTANVVNACVEHGPSKLVFVSSVAAISRSNANELITEQTPWLSTEKQSVYALSKYKAELEIWRGVAEGLNAVIVNPSIILGEGDWHSSSAQLYKHAYQQYPFYTSGVNGFVDVQDVAKAMWLLMQSDISGQRYILNGGNYPYKSVLEKIAVAMNRKPASHAAQPWMVGLLWRLYALRKFFTGKRALITKETAHTAMSVYAYDNAKVLQALQGFSFTGLDEMAARTGMFYEVKASK